MESDCRMAVNGGMHKRSKWINWPYKIACCSCWFLSTSCAFFSLRWNSRTYKMERTWIEVWTGEQSVSRLGTWVFQGDGDVNTDVCRTCCWNSGCDTCVLRREEVHTEGGQFISFQQLFICHRRPSCTSLHIPPDHDNPLCSSVSRSHSPTTQRQSKKLIWFSDRLDWENWLTAFVRAT